MRLLVFGFMLASATAAFGKPAAQSPQTLEAKRQYELGIASFNLQEFDKAVLAFEEGYRLRPDPVFLYNLGQSHRLLGHHERAAYFYRAYLRTAPDATNRAEVEARVASLEKLLATQRDVAKPPDGTIAPTDPSTKPEPQPAPVVVAPHDAVVVSATPRQKQPIYKKWWLWTIVGVAAVGLGVGLGLGLTQTSASPSYPNLHF